MNRNPNPARPDFRVADAGLSRRARRITDYTNRLLLMQAYRVGSFTHGDGNTTDSVTTAIWVLDGDRAPLLQYVTVTQKALVPALRCHMIGQPPLLARLVAKQHEQQPDRRIWVFVEPSPEDVQQTNDLLHKLGDPFRELRDPSDNGFRTPDIRTTPPGTTT